MTKDWTSLLAPRLEAIRARMEAACRRAGRSPGEVTLVAVSKRKPPEAIRAAYELGCRDFGENYGQEFRDKARALQDLPGLRWHFVGPLQRNKVKYVVGKTVLLHAVDSEPVIREIQKRASRLGHVQEVLVEVNLSGEATKAGIPPGELDSLLDTFAETPNVRCVGLMTMPPASALGEAARPYFVRLRELLERTRKKPRRNVELHHLSMGMTSDFDVAIEEGATLIRVGTALFGPRD